MIEGSPRVLIIEDDRTLRDVLAEVMFDEGYEVRLVGDGGEGLTAIAEWRPDVVLLDLMMPGMNGFELRERLATVAHRPPILVLSAARDVAEAAERLGADAWLAKPFSVADVIDAARRLVSAARS